MNQRIVFENTDGTVGVIVPAPGHSIDECMKAVPADAVSHKVIDVADLPQDRTFRNAWVADAVKGCKEDLVKAKAISHDRRRAKRAEEFAPLDVQATIPAQAAAAEAARAAIRAKYDTIQTNINACTDCAQLKALLAAEGL